MGKIERQRQKRSQRQRTGVSAPHTHQHNLAMSGALGPQRLEAACVVRSNGMAEAMPFPFVIEPEAMSFLSFSSLVRGWR